MRNDAVNIEASEIFPHQTTWFFLRPEMSWHVWTKKFLVLIPLAQIKCLGQVFRILFNKKLSFPRIEGLQAKLLSPSKEKGVGTGATEKKTCNSQRCCDQVQCQLEVRYHLWEGNPFTPGSSRIWVEKKTSGHPTYFAKYQGKHPAGNLP